MRSVWRPDQRQALLAYTIANESSSESITLNGTATHHGKEGALLTIMSFARATENEVTD